MREKKCILAIMAATMLMCTTGCGNAVPTGPINGGSNTSDVTVDDNNNTDVADIDADADSGDVVGDETGDQTADTGSQTDDQGQGDEGEDEGAVTDGYNDAEFSDSGQPLLDHCWINKEKTWRTKFDDKIGTYGKYLVGSRYEEIHLSDEAEKIYPELSRALLVANDLIATEQENLFISDCDAVSTMTEDEINSALDYQTYVRGKENEMFIRRADGDVLSFMSTTYAVESIEIAQRTYRAFNYDVKTGNRIELSDVVKDIDKFNELLVEKAIDVIAIPDFGVYKEDIDPAELQESINKALENEQGCWTLDPNGITFYFNNGAVAYPAREVNVLFADDASGEIFNDKYAERDTWIVYLESYQPYYFTSSDGASHMVEAGWYDLEDQEGNWGTSIYMNYDGNSSGDTKDAASGDEFALVKKGDKYWLYNFYDDYVYPAFDIYTIGSNGMEILQKVGMDKAAFSENSQVLGYYPIPIMTDVTNITLSVRTDLFSTCRSNCHFTMNEAGELSRVEDVLKFIPECQYTITANYALENVPEVSDEGVLTGVTTSIDKGEQLTMIQTDGERYVDMTRSNGEIVRINFYEEENGRFIDTAEGKKPSYEAFENMNFGQ